MLLQRLTTNDRGKGKRAGLTQPGIAALRRTAELPKFPDPRFSGTSGIRYLYGFNDCEMIFDLLHLKNEVEQPELRKAVVLRYWNEIFIPELSFQDLRDGRAKHAGVETIIREIPA